MGPKLSAWSVIWPKLAASGVIWHTSVMRDLLFSQRVTRDFPLKFPLWLISFETRSRHQLLALFSRSSTSDFLSSNDNRILVNVVNILFYFSMIGVMRDSYPPPPLLCHPNTASSLRAVNRRKIRIIFGFWETAHLPLP